MQPMQYIEMSAAKWRDEYAVQRKRIVEQRCVVCHTNRKTIWCEEHNIWCCPKHMDVHHRIAHPEREEK